MLIILRDNQEGSTGLGALRSALLGVYSWLRGSKSRAYASMPVGGCSPLRASKLMPSYRPVILARVDGVI